MKWFIAIAIAGLIYYRIVLVKRGKLDFWKLVRDDPEKAYSFFIKEESFLVFSEKPPNGYQANLPPGEWDGPFRLYVSSKNQFVAIYGRNPEYRLTQSEFMRNQNA